MKKILILALLVLGQLVFADSVSNWCGYNGELFEKFQNDTFFKRHVGFEKDNLPVIFASSFNEDTIKKIRERYKEANYDVQYLKKSIERDWKIKKGFWFKTLNSIFLRTLDIKDWYYSDTEDIVNGILFVNYKLNNNYIRYLKENEEQLLSTFAFMTYNTDWVYVNPMISLANIYVSMDDPDNKRLDEQREELKKILREKTGICK